MDVSYQIKLNNKWINCDEAVFCTCCFMGDEARFKLSPDSDEWHYA